MKDLKDRVAVVTGAAGGIGRAMVETFLDAGMKAVLAEMDEERLETARAGFKNYGAEVLAVPTDVSQAKQIEALAQKVFEIYIERGLDPKEIGRQVLNAIQEERFYVIPHDYRTYIRSRLHNILNAENPELLPPSPDFLKILEEVMGSPKTNQ